MLSLAAAAILEKNKLASTGAMVLLLEITLPDGTVLRVCSNTENVTWPSSGGETYTAFPFKIEELSEARSREAPRLAVQVGNASRAIQAYLEQGDGGVGAEVVLRVVNTALLSLADPWVRFDFTCTGCKADSQWVTFTLGAANPMRKRFPGCRVIKNFCRWKFGSDECGYTGSAYTTCDKTLASCRLRGNSTRFGGFPGCGKGALYV